MRIASIRTTRINFKNNDNQNTKKDEQNTLVNVEYFPNGQVKKGEYKNGVIIGYNENGDFAYEITRRRN